MNPLSPTLPYVGVVDCPLSGTKILEFPPLLIPQSRYVPIPTLSFMQLHTLWNSHNRPIYHTRNQDPLATSTTWISYTTTLVITPTFPILFLCGIYHSPHQASSTSSINTLANDCCIFIFAYLLLCLTLLPLKVAMIIHILVCFEWCISGHALVVCVYCVCLDILIPHPPRPFDASWGARTSFCLLVVSSKYPPRLSNALCCDGASSCILFESQSYLGDTSSP